MILEYVLGVGSFARADANAFVQVKANLSCKANKSGTPGLGTSVC